MGAQYFRVNEAQVRALRMTSVRLAEERPHMHLLKMRTFEKRKAT